jgi:hypothetical protein
MRPVRLIGEAVMDLLVSGLACLLLYVALEELLRKPGHDTAVLDSMVPVTERKLPWLIVIAVLLLLLWLGARAIGGPRGVLWGAWAWLVRIGWWWSVAALLLFIGVAAYGGSTRGLADVNWGFALDYLAVVVPLLLVCGYARRRGA